jgi:hypothetical protein
MLTIWIVCLGTAVATLDALASLFCKIGVSKDNFRSLTCEDLKSALCLAFGGSDHSIGEVLIGVGSISMIFSGIRSSLKSPK